MLHSIKRVLETTNSYVVAGVKLIMVVLLQWAPNGLVAHVGPHLGEGVGDGVLTSSPLYYSRAGCEEPNLTSLSSLQTAQRRDRDPSPVCVGSEKPK